MGKENEQETKQLASFTDAQAAEVKQHFAALLNLLEKAKTSDQGVDIGEIGQQIGGHLVAGVQNLQSLLSSASANELREALKDKAKGEKKKKKDKEGKKDKKKDKDEDESEGEKKKKDKEGKKDKKKDKDEDESEGEKKKKKDKKDKDKNEVEQHPVPLTEAQAGEAKKHFATLLEQLDKAHEPGAGADVGVVGSQIGEHLLAGVGILLAVLPSASANELREKLKEKAKAEKQKKTKKDKKKDEHDDDNDEQKKKEKKEKKEE